MSQMLEMPVIGTAETDSVTEAPEIKGYAYIKGLTIPKYKEAYVVVQDGAFVAYKDSSLQGVLLTFPLVPWRFKADAVVDKKDICKHGEYVLQIFQGAEPFFLAFPTANQLAVWESHMKLVLDAISPVIFGVPLKLAFHKSKATKAPAIIVKLIDVLEKNDALGMNGIFRVSAASSEVTKLREAFDTGNDALVEELLGSMTDYHVAAHLIKQFFRELPDPLLTYECYDRFVECEDNVAQISAVVATLPRENILTLHYLMTFLARVATHEEESKMGPSNLAIVFGPTILRNPKENTSTDAIRTEPVIQVCQTMIEHCDEIFASIDTTPATSSSSSSRPSGHARAPSASGKRFGKSDMFACGAAAAAIGLSGLKKTNTNAAITGGVGGSGGGGAAAGAVVAGRPSPATPKSPVAKRSLANSADVGGPKKEFVPVPKAQPVVKGGIRAGASSASFTLQKSAGPGPAGPAGGGGDMAAMRAELAKMRGNMEKLSAQCEEQDEKIKAQDAKIESQEEQIEELEKRLALAIEEKKKAEEENNGENGDEEDNEEDEEEKKKKEEEEEDGSDGGGDSNELDDAVKKKMEELEKMLGELKSVCDAQKKTIAANKKEIESLSEKVKKMDGAADEKQHKRHKSTVKKDDASPDIE